MNGIELKQKMRSGPGCVGAWVTLTDPVVAEIMSHVGFDFLVVDTEHSAVPLDRLQVMMLMMQRGGTPAIVRVPWNDPVMIKQVLDSGAEGVLIPMVRNAAEARRAVLGAKYPPAGVRGYGPLIPSDFYRREADYLREANDRTVVVAQIEDIEAVNRLEEIVGEPGIDAVYLGPADLSFTLGKPLQMDDPDLIAAMKATAAKARSAGTPFGGSLNDARRVDWNVQFVTVGADYGLMLKAAREMLASTREVMESLPTY
jgi:2-keto-3-deoxy-L-rhamnonate aldolase RhmA